MRILLISQYFFPETGATSNRIYSLAKKFQEQGHEVRVIAEKANHPRGVFFKGFERGFFLDQSYKGIPVTYSWVYTRPRKGFLGRILFYVSFMITAILASLRFRGKFDIVCASSPPLFVGISGWITAKLKRAKFVFDVRDLWPDVAISLGELNNKLAITVTQKIEYFLYRKAHLITAVTKSFKKSIVRKGVSEHKVKIVSNGTDPEVYSCDQSRGTLRCKLGLNDNFLVSYIGNIGLAQGLNHIVESARLIQKKGLAGISFLLVGDGPKKQLLRKAAEDKNLNNIRFVDQVSQDRAVEYMHASDVLLVPLGDDPIYSQFIPSKLFDSMSASKPVLLSVDGEARSVLEKARCGIYYEAEDAEQLAENIVWFVKHDEKAKAMGSHGRDFVVNNYTRDVQAQNMLTHFENLLNKQ